MPPGVRFAELAYLVDFMYHGEVSILQEEIQSFMNLAELLKVKVGNPGMRLLRDFWQTFSIVPPGPGRGREGGGGGGGAAEDDAQDAAGHQRPPQDRPDRHAAGGGRRGRAGAGQEAQAVRRQPGGDGHAEEQAATVAAVPGTEALSYSLTAAVDFELMTLVLWDKFQLSC